MLEIPCDARLYFGPFRFSSEGETVSLVSSIRSPSGVQVCSLSGEWVSARDEIDGTAGAGCAEGDATTDQEQTHTYAPGRGESGANPVYLRFQRHEPAGCPALTLSLVRRR